MTHLIAVSFRGEDTADQVLNKLMAMRKEHLIDLEDACVVVRDQKGRVRLKQAIARWASALSQALARSSFSCAASRRTRYCLSCARLMGRS